jgi:hypothetical protein
MQEAMGLGLKTALVATLVVSLIALKLLARRRDFERFQARHSRRKYRVSAGPPRGERDATR